MVKHQPGLPSPSAQSRLARNDVQYSTRNAFSYSASKPRSTAAEWVL